jgi:ribulose-bisphosphate carboxylase large chain
MVASGSAERLRVTYELVAEGAEEAEVLATAVAYEQSVELPPESVSDELRAAVVGRLEGLDRIEDGRFRAVVSYAPALAGRELPQLLNLLFGNVSLQAGIRVIDVDWPTALLQSFPGPRFGSPGLREMCRVEAVRPLVCAVAKPIGLTVRELAARCRALARGGVDLVKDDHSLADQDLAPFDERLQRCQSAVRQANRETGGHTLYVPHLTGFLERLQERAELAQAIGCRAVLVAPMLLGLPVVQWLAENGSLAMVGHPTGSGAVGGPERGVSPEVMLGQIYRLVGCDAVIFPHVGGRFRFSKALAEGTSQHLRRPWGGLRAALPATGGSVAVDGLRSWIDTYGTDSMFVVGASLLQESDLEAAAVRLMDAVRSRGLV